jgi:FKBP-type peptidyl-prolyl cis-trans isomerase
MQRTTKFIAGLLIASLSACASGGGGAVAARPIQSIPFAAALDVDLSRMTKTPSGLYYRDIVVGSGPVVHGKVDVKVHYTGWLTNGVKFDSNSDDEPALTVPLGRGRAIKGWDEGLDGMRVGGRRQLVIPPELGYGSNRSGLIPPDATLVFDLKIVSVK